MSTCTSYMHKHIYIVDIRLKEVNKCIVKCERSILVRIIIVNIILMLYIQIALGSILLA